MASSILMVLLLSNSLLLCPYFQSAEAQGASQPIVPGLSWTFYDSSCPQLENIVREQLQLELERDIGLAAGLLRLFFHDCFVQGQQSWCLIVYLLSDAYLRARVCVYKQGCDGSVLLDGSASGPSEQDAPPNLTLRPEAFEFIDDVRRRVDEECGRVVSCSDVVAIAARDAVFLSGGPDYDVPLGRRDGLTFATRNVTLANLPAPSSNTTALLISLATKNFTATDVVALSGGHTIGISHCTSFTDRLYPTQDPIMDQTFANNLKVICPTANSTNTTVQDIRSPDTFDNKYYVDLMNRQGLFTSDQDLYTDSRTRGIVTSFAINQSLFFEKFVDAMIKMSQLSVLTGNQGEIRGNCSVRNSDNGLLAYGTGEEKGAWSAF